MSSIVPITSSFSSLWMTTSGKFLFWVQVYGSFESSLYVHVRSVSSSALRNVSSTSLPELFYEGCEFVASGYSWFTFGCKPTSPTFSGSWSSVALFSNFLATDPKCTYFCGLTLHKFSVLSCQLISRFTCHLNLDFDYVNNDYIENEIQSSLCQKPSVHLWFHVLCFCNWWTLESLWKWSPYCANGFNISYILFVLCSVVKEEIVDDEAHLPCFNGRVVSWVWTTHDNNVFVY